jgi:hypothetical protein
MMIGLRKLDILRESYDDETELDQILGKLLGVVLDQQQARLARYDRDLRDFETRYQIASPVFYQRFEAGTLDDAADFFEWAGLYELRQELAEKVQRLELAA